MSEKTAQHIADKVRELREEKRLSQKQLSEKCGLSTNYISRIERADVSVSVNSLEKIAKALGVKAADILPF